MKRHRIGWSLAGLLLLSVATLRGDVENNLEKSFNVTAGGKLVVDADRGAIEVATGGGDKVEIQVQRKVTRGSAAQAEEIFANHDVTFQQEGNEVIVKARYKKDQKSGVMSPQLQVRYLVTLPRQFNVDLKTAGGSVKVPDLAGEARAQTAGGSLNFGVIDGPVWGRTAGGSVTVGGAKGAVDVETAGGSIKVGSVEGETKARTSGGSITVDAGKGPISARTAGGSIHIGNGAAAVTAETSGGSIHIKSAGGRVVAKTAGGGIEVQECQKAIEATTSAGAVTVALTGQPEDDCRLETSAGSIHLAVPGDISANLDAKTSGGRVSTDLPITVQGESKRSALVGKLGQGGKLLKLRTSAGNIEIHKR